MALDRAAGVALWSDRAVQMSGICAAEIRHQPLPLLSEEDSDLVKVRA
jgi:hypothetical protein